MEKSNLAVVLHGLNDLRIEERELPQKPTANELLLATNFCGLCGTDLHLLEEGRLSDFIMRGPFTPGHESTATVVEAGPDATDFKPGDRVTMEPALPCLACDYCREGLYNMCKICNLKCTGLPPNNGYLTRYFKHPANFCYKLPENVSLEEGALSEPLAVVVHAMRRVNMTVGQNVLVCGSGTMGMLSFLTAKAYGANKVIVTDIVQSRLDLALKLGADAVLLVKPTDDPKELSQKVIDLIGDGVHLAFECTGHESSTRLAIHSTRNGGKVALVGMGPLSVDVPLLEASLREVDLIGVCRFRNCFPTAVYLLASGKVNVKPLITHKFSLDNAKEAYATMKKGMGLKMMIDFSK